MLLKILPASILLLVVVFQTHLQRTESLAPVRGGSFGMFAYIPNRFIRCYLESGSNVSLCRFPPTSKNAYEKIISIPSLENMHAFAAELIIFYRQENLTSQANEILHLEYWNFKFDSSNKTLSPSPVLSIATPLNSGAMN